MRAGTTRNGNEKKVDRDWTSSSARLTLVSTRIFIVWFKCVIKPCHVCIYILGNTKCYTMCSAVLICLGLVRLHSLSTKTDTFA